MPNINQNNMFNLLIIENLSLLTHNSIYCKCLTLKQTLLYLFVTIRKFKEENKKMVFGCKKEVFYFLNLLLNITAFTFLVRYFLSLCLEFLFR